MKKIITILLVFTLVIPIVTTATELNASRPTPGFPTTNTVMKGDFIEARGAYSATSADADPYLYTKDLNNDGIIDIFDIVNLAKQYGNEVVFQPPAVEALLLADSIEYIPETNKCNLTGAGIHEFDFEYEHPQIAVYRSYANLERSYSEFVLIYEPSGAYMESVTHDIGPGDGWVVTTRFYDVKFRQRGKHYVVIFIDGVPIKDMEIVVE